MYDPSGMASKMYFSPESYLCRNLLAWNTTWVTNLKDICTGSKSSMGKIKTVKAQQASTPHLRSHLFSITTLWFLLQCGSLIDFFEVAFLDAMFSRPSSLTLRYPGDQRNGQKDQA